MSPFKYIMRIIQRKDRVYFPTRIIHLIEIILLKLATTSDDYKKRVEENKDNYRWSGVLKLPNIQNPVNPIYKTSIDENNMKW